MLHPVSCQVCLLQADWPREEERGSPTSGRKLPASPQLLLLGAQGWFCRQLEEGTQWLRGTSSVVRESRGVSGWWGLEAAFQSRTISPQVGELTGDGQFLIVLNELTKRISKIKPNQQKPGHLLPRSSQRRHLTPLPKKGRAYSQEKGQLFHGINLTLWTISSLLACLSPLPPSLLPFLSFTL